MVFFMVLALAVGMFGAFKYGQSTTTRASSNWHTYSFAMMCLAGALAIFDILQGGRSMMMMGGMGGGYGGY